MQTLYLMKFNAVFVAFCSRHPNSLPIVMHLSMGVLSGYPVESVYLKTVGLVNHWCAMMPARPTLTAYDRNSKQTNLKSSFFNTDEGFCSVPGGAIGRPWGILFGDRFADRKECLHVTPSLQTQHGLPCFLDRGAEQSAG